MGRTARSIKTYTGADAGFIHIKSTESTSKGPVGQAHQPELCSDASSNIKVDRPALRQSTNRSKTGCRVCRQRRVKCDETHPSCGSCRKLNKICEWRRDMKFENCNVKVFRNNRRVLRLGSPAWNPRMPRYTKDCYSSPSSPLVLPDFAQLETDDEREAKASLEPPGTHCILLTPDSFHRFIDSFQSDQENIRRDGVEHVSEKGTNVTIEPDHGVAVFLSRLPEQILLALSFSNTTSDAASMHSGTTYSKPQHEQYCLAYYKNFIFGRMIPLICCPMLGSGDEVETIILASKSFPPVSDLQTSMPHKH